MKSWERELVKAASADLQRRIAYRRDIPETETEMGTIDSIASERHGRIITLCVIPDKDDVAATIVWFDEVEGLL